MFLSVLLKCLLGVGSWLTYTLITKFIPLLQAEKIELETTVVDETKEKESCCAHGNRRFSGQFHL